MPMIIKHIDKITREKNRDTIYLRFNYSEDEQENDEYIPYNHETDEVRIKMLEWLDEMNIDYELCGPIASEQGWESYNGQIYIDLAMEDTNLKYKLLNNHLEDKDGNFIIDGIGYFYLPLKIAMKNKRHDVPGFWEEWAENF
jgi:hypothetical protein